MEVKQTSIRLPYEAWEKLKEITDRKGYSMSYFVLDELWRYAENGSKTTDAKDAD